MLRKRSPSVAVRAIPKFRLVTISRIYSRVSVPVVLPSSIETPQRALRLPEPACSAGASARHNSRGVGCAGSGHRPHLELLAMLGNERVSHLASLADSAAAKLGKLLLHLSPAVRHGRTRADASHGILIDSLRVNKEANRPMALDCFCLAGDTNWTRSGCSSSHAVSRRSLLRSLL